MNPADTILFNLVDELRRGSRVRELNVKFAMFSRKIDGIKYDAVKKLEALQDDLAKPLPIEVKYQKEADKVSLLVAEAAKVAEYNLQRGLELANVQIHNGKYWATQEQANIIHNHMAYNQNAKPYQARFVDRLSVLGNLGL